MQVPTLAPSERISVVHNGLDLARFDSEASLPISPPLPDIEGQRPIVAMVGNMKHPGKGHAELLRAAASVVHAVPECRFLLVGDGELRPRLERRARELGIARAVIFAGERTDVPALLT